MRVRQQLFLLLLLFSYLGRSVLELRVEQVLLLASAHPRPLSVVGGVCHGAKRHVEPRHIMLVICGPTDLCPLEVVCGFVFSLLILVDLKVSGVAHVCKLRHPRRHVLLALKQIEVVSSEEGVLHHRLRAAAAAAEPLLRVGDEQLRDQVLCQPLDDHRVGESIVHDLLVDAHGATVVKGRVAREHLEEQNAKRPAVGREAVPLARHNLRCKVLGRAAESVRLGSRRKGLRKAKVDYHHVPLGVEDKVLWLKVAVNDAPRVQVDESGGDTRSIEGSRREVKAAGLPQQRKELASKA